MNGARVFLACCLVAAGSCSHAAGMEPLRSIRVVVPYPKNGGPDRLVRLVVNRLEKELSQPLIVENRSGMFGILGTLEVSSAAPDGHTLAYADNTTLSYANVTYGRLIYRPDDLQPIGALFRVSDGIAVPATSSITRLNELIKQVKEQPHRISYTAPGRGSSGSLSGALLARATRLDWRYLPSRDSFQAADALEAGTADVLIDNLTMLLPKQRKGTLRILAVTGAERSPLLPGVPTVTEEIGTKIVNYGWGGFVAPKGTPSDVVKRFNAAVNRSLSHPATRAALVAEAASLIGGPPEQLSLLMRREQWLWTRLSGPDMP